jgi:hypothetical protein
MILEAQRQVSHEWYPTRNHGLVLIGQHGFTVLPWQADFTSWSIDIHDCGCIDFTLVEEGISR